MKKFLLLIFAFACITIPSHATPDTVKAGVYITSIHDIDFRQREYSIDLWLWLHYKKKQFDFVQNMEIPQAKTVNKSFSTLDSSNGDIYQLMKLQCVMQDSWKINNFPFDRQKLRFSLENSQFGSDSLVFIADTLGKHFDAKYTLRGWNIDSLCISTGKRVYETTFGDKIQTIPHSEYSTYKVLINIDRDAIGLFWKMFLGMYIAFLIAYMCFYIHADSFDSRFGLSVGALFAVVGNKYIVDASLPESNTFTLVDMLHGITLAFVLLIIMCNAYSLLLVKREKEQQARRFDMITAQIFLLLYIGLNIFFIMRAVKG